ARGLDQHVDDEGAPRVLLTVQTMTAVHEHRVRGEPVPHRPAGASAFQARRHVASDHRGTPECWLERSTIPPNPGMRGKSGHDRENARVRGATMPIPPVGTAVASKLLSSRVISRRTTMPEKKTLERARQDAREGKSPSTQAGEFVKEEMDHIREGKHGARSAKQAIAIGLSKARRAGIKLVPPKNASPDVTEKAARDSARGRSPKPVSAKRSKAVEGALKREGHAAASHLALS